MERKKTILNVILLFLCLMAEGISYRTEIYRAYTGKAMDQWKKAMDEMYEKRNNDPAFLLELINYQYGYIGWAIGNGHKKEATGYLKIAEDLLAGLEKSGSNPSMISAYKSAFNAYKISLNPIKAPFLGPKSLDFAKLSVSQDQNNYFGYVLMGNAYYNMPPAFGGSKKTALSYFLQAEKLIESDQARLKEDWNYLSLEVFIGQAYQGTGQYDKAKGCYEKILKFEPGFLWIKEVVYPQLLDLMKKEK